MKKFLLIALSLSTFVVFGRQGNVTQTNNNQVSFIENRGQWPQQVHFLLKTNGVNVWITKKGIVYDYYRYIRPENTTGKNESQGIIQGHVVAMSFGSDIKVSRFQAQDLMSCQYNYFIGNDPDHWATGVSLYKKVTLDDVYPGIDMELYTDNGNFRYDFVLQPGANPEEIKLAFTGAEHIGVDKGELLIKTTVGDKWQGDIHAFQGDKEIDCRLIVHDAVAGFIPGNYDHTKPLRIDPLVYSTYLGGSSDDVARDVVTGDSHEIYVAGFTWSLDFPTTTGAYQKDLKGADDVFVSGFTADGSDLIFSTYLGGTYSDEAYALAYKNGQLYITGVAFSEDFPITSGAFQEQNHLGGDVFVTSLSGNGQSLGFSTYVGGFGFDRANDIEAGANILVGGYTNAADFPVTGDAYDNTFGGGAGILNDGFVFEMSTSGEMIYSSFLGGTSDDMINGIALYPGDSNLYYIAGQTTSSDFPVTDDAYDGQLGDGSGSNEDAFITVFSGNKLIYGTYLGGTSTDMAIGVTVNSGFEIMVAGNTFSDDFPVTPDAFSNHPLTAYEEAFVAKLKPDGNAATDDLKYSSYFGGSFEDEVSNVFLEGSDKFYISGYTASQNFPTTPGAVSQEAIGNKDAFVTRFNFNGNTLDYSTYLGGSFDDVGYGMAEKQNGQIILSGLTVSFNFPVTDDAYDPSYNEGSYDAFLSVIGIVPTGIFEHQERNNISICQNQPNPFRTKTTIFYRLNNAEDVTFTVYSINGKEIMKQSLPGQSAGEHQIDLDMTGFSPGVYFYSIKSGNGLKTRKMIVR